MKRRLYRIDKAGSIDDLKLREDELPVPGDLEVTVEVKAVGLNFADIFAIQGLYKAAPKENFVPGLEYSGVIIRVGKMVKNLKVGDRVMGVTRFGAYVSHLNIDSQYVFPLHDDWSFEEGAGFLVQVLTAYYGLVYLGALEKEATILIHSAAGGVGIWANRIAKNYGAFTIGTIGSEKKIDFCKQEGYDEVIVRSENFEDDLKKSLKGRSLNLIMDCIGGTIFKTGYRLLAPQGRVVVYGSARYTTQGSKPNFLKLALMYWRRPKVDPQTMINFNKSIMGFNLIYLYEKAGLMEKLLKEMNELQLDKPVVGHTYPFEKLHEAIYFFQTGKTVGKVVLIC
jgi:NADPH:quinone reductase-like Zn-dependent oxidoreductase